MSPYGAPRGRGYLLFLLAALGLAALLAAVGYFPSLARGGPAAVEAMLFACGVSWTAALVSGLPIALATGGAQQGLQLFLASMLLRLLTVAGLGAAAAFGAGLATRPFLLWLGISYLVLLPLDVGYAWRTLSRL